MLYFTSDTHYNHGLTSTGFNEEKNILKYCNRPYASIDEMNHALIRNHNARVNDTDMVIHLGDFALGPTGLHEEILGQLNGEKVLVAGNHDQIKKHKKISGWSEITDQLYVIHGNMRFWCAHVPSDNASDHVEGRDLKRPRAISGYDIELCGHVHTAWRDNGTSINVGVDMWDYRPISADEVIAYYLSHLAISDLIRAEM